MTRRPPLSGARRRALEVLVRSERAGRAVKESNHTSEGDETVWCTVRRCGEQVHATTDGWRHLFVDPGHDAVPTPATIYWQSRQLLERNGLITTRVTVVAGASGVLCRLTKAGREYAKEAGIR